MRKFGTPPPLWISLTVAGAIVGYALPVAGGASEPASAGAEPGVWLLPVLGAGFGLVLGTLMGAIQWIADRDTITFWAWVTANAVGWSPDMAIIIFSASLVDRTWPLYLIASVGASVGALAGLSVGAVTGIVVQRAATRLKKRPKLDAERSSGVTKNIRRYPEGGHLTAIIYRVGLECDSIQCILGRPYYEWSFHDAGRNP